MSGSTGKHYPHQAAKNALAKIKQENILRQHQMQTKHQTQKQTDTIKGKLRLDTNTVFGSSAQKRQMISAFLILYAITSFSAWWFKLMSSWSLSQIYSCRIIQNQNTPECPEAFGSSVIHLLELLLYWPDHIIYAVKWVFGFIFGIFGF
ncbi:hypothetical protein LP092_15085 (plasmid) [Moraxella bovis]|uniref:Uncharacterized protein n=1 Tax=Moraxella bovis TaxID=476 RepID=A0ABY6MD07_MORBO|nr:hypothetical protein [Moraxella bovis]UZA04800.1 hypothetical protein LP092_15085 [Moraxella bovis]